MRVGGQTLVRVATLIDSHQLSSSFDRAFTVLVLPKLPRREPRCGVLLVFY